MFDFYSKLEIEELIREGKAQGADYLIIACDTFAEEEFPVYVMPGEILRGKLALYDGIEMQEINRVYDIRGEGSKCLQIKDIASITS